MSDLDSEIAELEASMAEDIDGYFKDEAAQARYAALIEARETGSAAPVSDRNAARRAELEDMMRQSANTSPYWHSEELQREYAALLEAPPSAFDAVGEVDRGTGERTVGDVLGLDADGAQEMAARIERAFEGIDTTDLDTAWCGLSERAQWGLLKVLADPPSVLRDQSTVDAFADWIGTGPFEEILAFEAGMSPEERAALRRACLLT